MPKMKKLDEVSAEEQLRFVDSFKHILLETDGVIWYNYKPIPGAVECLDRLKKIGKKISFVTNNSSARISTIRSNLEKNNFDSSTEIINPPYAIVRYLKDIKFDRTIFAVASEEFKEELRVEGFTLLPDPPAYIKEDIGVFLENIKDDPSVGAVIFDFDLNLTRLKLQKALTYLKRSDCLFIVGAADRTYPFRHGIGPIIGNQHIFQSLADISRRDYFLISKPSPHFLEFVVNHLDVQQSSKILVIGDSVPTDMALGAAGGYQKLLVLSGQATPNDILNWKYPEDWKPEYYVKDLETLNKILKSLYKC